MTLRAKWTVTGKRGGTMEPLCARESQKICPPTALMSMSPATLLNATGRGQPREPLGDDVITRPVSLP